ncbi:creatininase family protein [Vibrio mimicus]|uniref:creatininase family protein n=1 Tax=Vibrio mimicus TaxID=674 RepID=UPI0012ACA7FA|nr:creatininase family protein [Vibrio mimicus]
MFLEKCNESEAIKCLKEAEIAFLPLGATEPHGDHLPLGTDSYLAEHFTALIAELFPYPSVILPTLPYSQVWSLKGFAGAIDIGNELLTHLVVKLAKNMQSYGISTLVIINAHYGNFDALKSAARLLKENGAELFVFSWPGTDSVIKQIRESKEAYKGYMHACEIETSIALALIKDEVDMSLAKENYPIFPTHFSYLPIQWTEFSQTAILGDPTKATQNKGQIIVEASSKTIVEILTKHVEECR